MSSDGGAGPLLASLLERSASVNSSTAPLLDESILAFTPEPAPPLALPQARQQQQQPAAAPAVARRSVPLAAAARRPKLESFDKMLARAPMRHVRLAPPAPAAAPPPRKTGVPALTAWLSPQKAKPPQGPLPDVSAAAAAELDALGDAATGGSGISGGAGGLRRIASEAALSGLAPPRPLGAIPRRRRVSFDVLPHPPAAAAASRWSPLPEEEEEEGVGEGEGYPSLSAIPGFGAAAGAAGGGWSPGADLVVLGSSSAASSSWGGSGQGGGGGWDSGVLPPSTGSYHRLAGLNLEGAAAHEATAKRGEQLLPCCARCQRCACKKSSVQGLMAGSRIFPLSRRAGRGGSPRGRGRPAAVAGVLAVRVAAPPRAEPVAGVFRGAQPGGLPAAPRAAAAPALGAARRGGRPGHGRRGFWR